MDIRATVFGSTLRVAGIVVVALVVLVLAGYLLGVLGVPSVTAVENRFGGVNESNTVVETDLVVDNPNPVGVRLGGTTVDYTVNMNDVALATGEKSGIALGTGETTLPFTTSVRNERIPDWWVSHVGGDEREHTEVTVDATVRSSLLGGRSVEIAQQESIDTDIIGQFRSNESRPVNASSPLVSDPVLVVRRTGAQWGTVTDAETPIRMWMDVYNPKPVPYVVTEIGYNITMNGVAVGNGTTDESYVIPGESEERVRMRTVVDNDRLDEWWVTHLRRNQVTDLRIDFFARVELPSGQVVRVPLDALTYERTIETDIFGNKNESSAPTAGSGGGDATTSPENPTTGDGLLGDTTDGGIVPTAGETTNTTDDGLLSVRDG